MTKDEEKFLNDTHLCHAYLFLTGSYGREVPGYASSSRTPPHLIPDDTSQDMSLSASSVQEDSMSLSSIDTDYTALSDDKKSEVLTMFATLR